MINDMNLYCYKCDIDLDSQKVLIHNDGYLVCSFCGTYAKKKDDLIKAHNKPMAIIKRILCRLFPR